MSTQYNPDGTLPQATSGYNPIAITSSTNATPIEVTTGTHGYATGDTVAVEGHLVNTNANGLHIVTVVSSTKFTLDGTIGNGVGGATGYAIDYAVNPLLTLPSDIVDLMNVSSINPAIEGAANAIPYMYKRVGAYSLYAVTDVARDDAITIANWSSTSVTNSAAWVPLTSADFLYQWSFGRDINVQNTDLLTFEFSTYATIPGALAVEAISIGINPNAGGWQSVPGSAIVVPSISTYVGPLSINATMFGNYLLSGTLNSIHIGILGWNAGAGAQTFQLQKPYHLTVKHYRSNV